MIDFLLIEGEGACIHVQAPGFIVEVNPSTNKVTPLSHHARNAVNVVSLDSPNDDSTSIRNALRALPEAWIMALVGVSTSLVDASIRVKKQLANLEPGVEVHSSLLTPEHEVAITNASGEVVVLFQKNTQPGISIHIAKNEHIGLVFGSVYDCCIGSELTSVYCSPMAGLEVARWDMSKTSHARAFLEEFEPRLDRWDYCRDARLLKFCKLNVLNSSNVDILDF